MSGYTVGFSEHPDPGVAAGEVCGAVLDGVGHAPDVAVVFVSSYHVESLPDFVTALHSIVAPRAVIGITTSTVIAGTREVENAPAIAVWAKAGAPGALVAHLDLLSSATGSSIVGLTPRLTAPGTIVLLADPFSFPAPAVLELLEDIAPDTAVVGGLASASLGPGQSRLIVDRDLSTSGAAALFLPATELSCRVETVVSQGCRPIGSPYIVTGGDANRITALAGRPPLDHLRELHDAAEPEEVAQLRSGIHIGKAIDESKVEFGRGDFLIRGIAAIDNETGAISIGDTVTVGDTVQFHVRDARSATDDLQAMAARPAAAGLLFSCTGRGPGLFDRPDPDATVVQDAAGPLALAGMACAGEFGPVGGHNFLHSYTASLALFDD